MDVSREGDEEEEEDEVQEGSDYDYLLGMKMWALTEEKKNELLRHRDEKEQELQKLKVNHFVKSTILRNAANCFEIGKCNCNRYICGIRRKNLRGQPTTSAGNFRVGL